MKEKNRKIWQGIKSVMLVITVVFVFVAVTSSIAMSGKNSVSELLPVQWTVFKHMDDGRQSNIVTTDISEVNFRKNDGGTRLIATTKIPNGGADGIMLQMCLKRTAYEVEIDGKKITSYEIGRYKKNKALGNGYHFISIDTADYGKKITVSFYMNRQDSYENIRKIDFVDGKDAEANLASKNFVFILLCSFLVVFGMIISLIGAMMSRKGRYPQFLHIGCYSFLIGLYVLSSRYMLQIFNPNLLVNTFLEYFSMFLLPTPVMLYSLEIISKKRKIFRWYMKIYVMVDIAATFVTVIAYFFYDFHLNRVSGYYRVFMIMGLLSLFIANFRRIFNNVDDKLRASVLWVLIISNTIPLLSFVLSKNPGGMSDLPVYLMPVGNIYIILALLFSYLMNYMKVFKDDVERQVLLRMAYTDSMTGLYNRAKSMEEFEKLDNGSEAYCVVWLDLNYLKRTNDRYGHEEGDMLITRFSGILKNAFDDIGTVCRMGGDEFCVIIKKSMNDIKIKKCINKMHEFIDEDNKGGNRYFMQTSYGIAGSEEFDMPKTDGVCSRADERMYEMKVKMKAQRTD